MPSVVIPSLARVTVFAQLCGSAVLLYRLTEPYRAPVRTLLFERRLLRHREAEVDDPEDDHEQRDDRERELDRGGAAVVRTPAARKGPRDP